jgi:peptidyl-tRNA hydrolase
MLDDRDDPAQIELRRAQRDPWVMYLVVRSDLERTSTEVLLAAAEATMRCADELASLDAHRDAFAQWSAQSFRKVSVRAKGRHWEKLVREYPGACGSARGEPLVRALVPRKRSENDAFLRGLQVYNPADASPVAGVDPSMIARSSMCFALHPRVSMTLGKSVAQVGHAVLLCAWSAFARANPARIDRWRAAGYPCAIAARDERSWRALRSIEGSIVVRDAGLTEVEPGSETVCAAPPFAIVDDHSLG